MLKTQSDESAGESGMTSQKHRPSPQTSLSLSVRWLDHVVDLDHSAQKVCK